ncbi:hypothetical protein NKG05_30200 [Oerskovia sp. M15]
MATGAAAGRRPHWSRRRSTLLLSMTFEKLTFSLATLRPRTPASQEPHGTRRTEGHLRPDEGTERIRPAVAEHVALAQVARSGSQGGTEHGSRRRAHGRHRQRQGETEPP